MKELEVYKNHYIYDGYIIKKSCNNGILESTNKTFYIINIELKTKLKALGKANTIEEALELFLKSAKRHRVKLARTPKQLILF
ncbi:MAG: hypothetical protein ACRC5T_09015 [Cetobacterium sp.]